MAIQLGAWTVLDTVPIMPTRGIGTRSEVVAEFWKIAGGYRDEPPPSPFSTREEWLAQFDGDEDDEMGAAWLHDPTGLAPRLCLDVNFVEQCLQMALSRRGPAR